VSVRQLVRFFPTVAAIGLILAGCSGGHVVYETSSHHAFPTVRQTSGVEAHPVQGIDIAKYQGDVDFQRVRDSGVSFVFIKATEGGDHLDSRFRENWDKARAAGLPRGAYHFAYWCRPMKEQAAWFIANVPNDPDAMPPVLDVEWNNDSQSCRRKVPKEEALLEMRDFIWAVEAHYGKKPIIYADYNFHKDIMADGHFGSYPFWVRSVKHLPHDRFNRTWTFWQYTAKGSVPGIAGDVDRNVFSGTKDNWRQLLANRFQAPDAAAAPRQAPAGVPAAPGPSVPAPSAPVPEPGAEPPAAEDTVATAYRAPATTASLNATNRMATGAPVLPSTMGALPMNLTVPLPQARRP
jgi:lysozyme